jgi:hypothetical protein
VTLSREKYTLLLSATSKSASIPQGTGYATMTVSAKEGVVMAGKLPDGESFSTLGVLLQSDTGNQFEIANALSYPSVTNKGESGFLLGTLTFTPVTGTSGSDLNGTLTWIKPEQSTGDYPVAINTNLKVIGSVYTYAKGGSVLPGFPVEGGTNSGTLALSNTSGLILSENAQLSSANKLIVPSSAANLKVTITPSTGVFKGTFLYDDTTPTSFSGVLFQDQIKGGGFFMGPDGSGTVSLTGT